MSKSVDKSQGNSAVDRPTAQEIARLLGDAGAPPKVYAYEIADRLGIDQSSLSLFHRGRRALPRGLTVKDYESALEDLKRAKRLEAVA